MDIGKQEKWIENLLDIQAEQEKRFQGYKVIAAELFQLYNEFITAGFDCSQALCLVAKQLEIFSRIKTEE